jgi:hypothetical protein
VFSQLNLDQPLLLCLQFSLGYHCGVNYNCFIMNFYKCLGSDSLPGEDLQDDKTINRMIKYLIFLKIYIWFLITANGLYMKRSV